MAEFEPLVPHVEVEGRAMFPIVDGIAVFKDPEAALMRHYLIADPEARRMKRATGRSLGPEAGPIGFEIAADTSATYGLHLHGWYHQERWLKAFSDLCGAVGKPVIHGVGLRLPPGMVFPQGVESAKDAIVAYNVAYHRQHRIGAQELYDGSSQACLEGIGSYQVLPMSTDHMLLVVCSGPYPCDFDRGLIEGMGTRFHGAATVVHDDAQPCRAVGGAACTYMMTV